MDIEPRLEKKPIDHWCYLPRWIRADTLSTFDRLNLDHFKCWVVSNHTPFSKIISSLLTAKNIEIKEIDLSYISSPTDLAFLEGWHPPHHIFIVLDDPPMTQDKNWLFHFLIQWMQWIAENLFESECVLSIITQDIYKVLESDTLSPEKSLLIGPCKVFRKEVETIRCNLIDVHPLQDDPREVFATILANIFSETQSFEGAYRGKERWVQSFDPVLLSESTEKQSLIQHGGRYLIIGGTGGIGTSLVDHLATKWNAKLILFARQKPPHFGTHLARLQEQGRDIEFVQGDVGNEEQVLNCFETYYQAGKPFDGIIHAAGVAGGGFIQCRTRQQFDAVLKPKVDGLINLEKALSIFPTEFLISFGSLSAILGEIGQADYCSANSFLDSITYRLQERLGIRTMTIHWARWDNVGMARQIASSSHQQEPGSENQWIAQEEGIQVFDALLSSNFRQVIVSPYDPSMLLQLQETDPLRL